MTTATTVEQRYWEDVAEGDELPGFALYLSETKIAEQVSGSQDFYPVHHDREFARAGGHPDIFVNTGFTRAALSRLLTDYVGTDGWVRRLSYEMRRMNRPGDTMQLRGRVAKKYVADDGDRCVDVELWVQNEREGVTTPATATVMLPARE
ncbi:MAG: MaoC/PaaZ C-terminal domain-containing protein [Dehalococcoidia bacterium]